MIGGRQGRLRYADDELVSYLPLSHVAAQILDIFIPLTFASTVYFAQPDALKVILSCSFLCLARIMFVSYLYLFVSCLFQFCI